MSTYGGADGVVGGQATIAHRVELHGDVAGGGREASAACIIKLCFAHYRNVWQNHDHVSDT